MTPADPSRSERFTDERRFRRSAFALAIVLLLVAGSLVPNGGPALVFERPREPQATLNSWLLQEDEATRTIRRLQQELRAEQSARRPFATKTRLQRLQAVLDTLAREGDLAH
jgi:hypothetical protein